MGIIKGFTFDGVNSLDYNIGITGSAVYNAPTRDVEMISIPGRDGEYALDHGRFNNIEITYPSGMGDNDQTNFAQRVSDLRNQLASRVGYKRLEDEYNPDEYRMAIYKSGLEVSPVQYSRAGQFDIIFDCKPQRFLLSGDEPFVLGEWGQTETKSGSIVSFEGDETTAIKSLTAQIVPKQSGSGEPSPSNVRPISGWDSVGVNVREVNIWDEEWEVGALNGETGLPATNPNYIRSKNFCSIVPNASYYVKAPSTTSNVSVFFYDNTQTFISVIYKFNATFTAPSNARYFKIMPLGSYGTTYNNDISINYPNTDHNYHAHKGTSYPISLGQTVYGGTLDVVSGVLTIKMAIVDLGTLTWTKGTEGSNTFFWANLLNGSQTSSFKGACSNYPITTDSTYSTDKTARLYGSTQWGGFSRVGIRDDRYTDATAFKTAMNGVELVYELATPTEIQLTPTEVNTLLGNNNIWADSGDVTVEIGQNPYMLVNPTLFEAHPLISFNASGNGTITINGQEISLLNAPYGTIAVPYRILRANARDTIIPEGSLLNTGDTFTVIGAKVTFTLQSNSPITVSVPSGQDLQFYPPESGRDGNKYYLTFRDTMQASSFTKGTAKTVTKTASLTLTTGGTTYNKTVTLEMGLNSNTQLAVDWGFNAGGVTIEKEDRQYTDLVVTGDSTVYSLTGDLYIDLDIGEAYSVQNGVYSSINNYVSLGGELPTLPPGNSTITYSNTISNFKITPRWWKI